MLNKMIELLKNSFLVGELNENAIHIEMPFKYNERIDKISVQVVFENEHYVVTDMGNLFDYIRDFGMSRVEAEAFIIKEVSNFSVIFNQGVLMSYDIEEAQIMNAIDKVVQALIYIYNLALIRTNVGIEDDGILD